MTCLIFRIDTVVNSSSETYTSSDESLAVKDSTDKKRWDSDRRWFEGPIQNDDQTVAFMSLKKQISLNTSMDS